MSHVGPGWSPTWRTHSCVPRRDSDLLMSRKLDEPEWGRWSLTWRTHSCVPCRDSSRRPVRAQDSHTVSKSRAGVEMSLDTARRSACATSATNLAHSGSSSFLIDSEKPGDIREV